MAVAVDAGRLKAYVRAILLQAGSLGDEAAKVADHLVDANLKGHDSHGVGMLRSAAAIAASGRPCLLVAEAGKSCPCAHSVSERPPP